MPKTLWKGTFAAVICSATLALSAQTYPPSQSPASPGKDKDKGQTVTVTGCIERVSQSAVGTSGTTGSATASTASSGAAGFLLTNVTAGTSGMAETTTPTPSPASTATSYRLDGSDSELAPHVGHKVEITGRVASSETAAMTPSREPGQENPPSASAASSSQASAPKLKVESVKMISESCEK